MFDRNLNYEDSLDTVCGGADYVEARLDCSQIRQIKDAIELFDALIRTSSIAQDGLFARMEVIGGVCVRLKQKDIKYAKSEWGPSDRLYKNFFGHELYNRLTGASQRLVEQMLTDLAAGFELNDEVTALIEEMIRNTAEHHDWRCARGGLWEVDLHASRSGVLASTYQAGLFNLEEEFTRRMALPPDQTPHGEIIPRPRYWYDFGNGDGFIRGNGLAELYASSAVRVNFEFEEEAFGPVTRVFLYSNEHLK